MNTPAAPDLREAFTSALRFEPAGAPSGNLTLGRGALDGGAIAVALVENRAASGAIGRDEAPGLAALFRDAQRENLPVALYLDSAGAKVSEGLSALGGFRDLYRAGLDAVFAGIPIAAVLGRNCFGGASMVAHLARGRLFGPRTRLGMSGPAVIAGAGGMNALDPAFQAMAQAAMAPEARAKVSPLNTAWAGGMDLAAWLRATLLGRDADVAHSLALRHQALGTRLRRDRAPRAWGRVARADLERLYPQGHGAEESGGLLRGSARTAEGEVALVGLVGPAPVDAQRAWEFADAVWRHREAPPACLEVLLDCASHAPSLEDERIVQTEFVVDMAFALAALARDGTRVGLTVVGKAGGGVYVALAAPAVRVAAVHGADIQVLPGNAVTAILGESRDSAAEFSHYRAARVAEEELKTGLVPPR